MQESSEDPQAVVARLPAVTMTLGTVRGSAGRASPGLAVAAVTLSPAGERGLLRLRHYCDGYHQFSDVDVL